MKGIGYVSWFWSACMILLAAFFNYENVFILDYLTKWTRCYETYIPPLQMWLINALLAVVLDAIALLSPYLYMYAAYKRDVTADMLLAKC